jgi:sigma-B regulation protein RsbU (phosphoserine phosphatase)
MGGDIFNMFQLDDDHWGIYMLDVSGHGVQAAMVTVSVSQFLQPNSGHLLSRKSGKSGTTSELRAPADVLVALDTEFPFERFNNFFTITYLITAMPGTRIPLFCGITGHWSCYRRVARLSELGTSIF